MNMFIQNCVLLASTVADKVDKVADKSAKVVAKTTKDLTTWDQLVLYWHKIESFYTDHATLINILVVAVVVGLLYRWVCSSNKKFVQSSLDTIADHLANWLAPQANFTAEELKPEFLLLLQGKKSEVLSEVALGLKCEYTEQQADSYTRSIQFFYQKGEDVLKTTFSNKMTWSDLPSNIRKEFSRTNCHTIVFDYLKQAIEESK